MCLVVGKCFDIQRAICKISLEQTSRIMCRSHNAFKEICNMIFGLQVHMDLNIFSTCESKVFRVRKQTRTMWRVLMRFPMKVGVGTLPRISMYK